VTTTDDPSIDPPDLGTPYLAVHISGRVLHVRIDRPDRFADRHNRSRIEQIDDVRFAVGQSSKCVRLDIERDHRGTLTREQLRDGAADALGGTCDEDPFFGEAWHFSSLVLRGALSVRTAMKQRA
jgi:hypothetical protein